MVKYEFWKICVFLCNSKQKEFEIHFTSTFRWTKKLDLIRVNIWICCQILQKSLEEPKLCKIWVNGSRTGTMAQSWRGGIGKYPPIPERFGNTSRCPEAKPREEGGISRPRRMRWVFSNPTEPWLCHCHCNSEKNKYC